MPPKRSRKEQAENEGVRETGMEVKRGRGEGGETNKVLYQDPPDKTQTPDGRPVSLKITSWNVDGLRAWIKKGALKWVMDEDPDVLCLQETKCPESRLPPELLSLGQYQGYWASPQGREGYSGVGVLSRIQPLTVTYGIGIEEHDTEGRVITLEFVSCHLVCVYVPNSGRGLVRLGYRETWDRDFRSYLQTLAEVKPVILCGDLNVAHAEIDLRNPKTNKKTAGFSVPEREAMSQLLSGGFVDTFRALYPEASGAFSFWTNLGGCRARNVGWRLDYFLLSQSLLPSLVDSKIRTPVLGSDHCPITLLLALPGA